VPVPFLSFLHHDWLPASYQHCPEYKFVATTACPTDAGQEAIQSATPDFVSRSFSEG